MHFDLVAKFLFLLAIANGAPIMVRRILGNTFSRPLDGGLELPDGHQLFGASKTIRGLVAALVATALVAPVINLSWTSGLTVAALAMAGDLISSFVKRRFGLAPGSRFTGLDQIPEALIPALAGTRLLALGVYDVFLVVVLFFVGEILLSRLLFRLTIRQRPY